MEDVSEYEQQRLKNIARNKQVLQSLEIENHKLPIPVKKGVKRKLPIEQKADVEPQRRSSRLQNKPAPAVTSAPPPLSSRSTLVLRRVPTPHVPPAVEANPSVRQPLPTRNAEGQLVFATHPRFTPNLSPQEVIRLGSFGGGYFRKIFSRITHSTHQNDYKEFPSSWFKGLDKENTILRENYEPSCNKYKVKAGQGLIEWEDSGWISAQDPRGWFQWYCRFYMGRRSSDDERQIARWQGVAGANGRWKKDLVAKIVRAGASWDDESVSPTVRQTLQHWAFALTKREYDAFI